jgi:hypothetical protein
VTDPREKEFRDTRRDDPARFLRELREMRSHAGLGHAELAARAHYPLDAIKAAETGPALPDLPVLSAYVRGCGGTVAEWEERWRAVTDSPASPLLTARGAAWSEAADAGARVAAESFPADEEDSDRVIAALNRVADRMAASASSSPSGAAPSPARNTDGWTPDPPAARDTDVWTPAPRTREPGTAADSIAAQAVPLTRGEADALTAEMAAGSGDRSRAADTGTRRPNAPTGVPVPAGRTASRRSAQTSRTTLTVYAVIALVLTVTLIALFA